MRQPLGSPMLGAGFPRAAGNPAKQRTRRLLPLAMRGILGYSGFMARAAGGAGMEALCSASNAVWGRSASTH